MDFPGQPTSQYKSIDQLAKHIKTRTPMFFGKEINPNNLSAPVQPHIQTSIAIYSAMMQRGGSRDLYDIIIKEVNKFTKNKLPELLSPYLAKKALQELCPAKPKAYPVCVNGCKMILSDDENDECNHCHEMIYKEENSEKPRKTMIQLPLKDQLKSLVQDKKTRELLKYPFKRHSNKNVMTDIFDGKLCQTILKHIKGEHHIFLSLYTDDFNVHKRSTHSMTIAHIQILNFPPEKRTQENYMAQVYLTPGPKKPQEPFTFMDPLLSDFESLCKEGVHVDTGDKEEGVIKVHAHLLYVGGDTPAQSKMAGHRGHTSYHGCRYCTIKGLYNNHRMTFPPHDIVLPTIDEVSNEDEVDSNSNIRNENIEEIEEEVSSDEEGVVVADDNGDDSAGGDTQEERSSKRRRIIEEESREGELRDREAFKGPNLAKGQKNKCKFAELPLFHAPTFFPVDIMHALGPGIAKQLWRIICGKYGKQEEHLFLNHGIRSKIGDLVAKSKILTPSSFSGSCGDTEFQGGFYKAVDWIHFVLYFMPTIALEFFDDPKTKQALVDLSQIYRYVFSRNIHTNQLDQFEKKIESWINWLKDQVQNGNLPVTVFTINQHYLTHLPDTLIQMGPLPYTSAFAMERAIGTIKRCINGKKDAAANSGNILIGLAAIRREARLNDPYVHDFHADEIDSSDEDDGAEEEMNGGADPYGNIDEFDDYDGFKHNMFEDDDNEDIRRYNVMTLSMDKDEPEIWGPYSRTSVANLHCHTPLRNYWARVKGSYGNVSIRRKEKLLTGSRLWKNTMVFGGVDSMIRFYLNVNTDNTRSKNINMDKRQYFGDIKCFFCHEFDGKDAMLALIEVFKTEEVPPSPWPCKLTESKMVIIHVNEIVGYVGVAKGKDNDYFYWSQERLGYKKELPYDHGLDYIR